jgi:hypothetical protein
MINILQMMPAKMMATAVIAMPRRLKSNGRIRQK